MGFRSKRAAKSLRELVDRIPPPLMFWLCQIDGDACCSEFTASNGIDLSCSSCVHVDRCREHGRVSAKGHPLLTDEPMVIRDCLHDPRWPFGAEEPEVRSAYVLPLRLQDRSLGIMVLGHPGVDGVCAADLPLARSLAAGATGILAASHEFTALVDTLEERVRDASLHLRELVAWVGGPERGRNADLGSGVGSLSDREREVLSSFLAGDAPQAIAGALFISPHTVRNHMKSIFRKLDVHSRSELLQRFQTQL